MGYAMEARARMLGSYGLGGYGDHWVYGYGH